MLRGLRAHLVYYNDHYAGKDERKRVMGNVTFEHQYLNAGFDYLDAKDQALATSLDIESGGYSIWATPRLPLARGASLEMLARYDHWTPNRSSTIAPPSFTGRLGVPFSDQKQNRTIFGVSYWFPHEGNVTTAILVDYDGQGFENIPTAPTKGIAIHGLLNF